MSHRFPFSLLPPSLGEQLLASATTARLTFSRWPGDGPATCRFRIEGVLADDANQAAIAAALAREFRTPLPRAERDEQEGGASC